MDIRPMPQKSRDTMNVDHYPQVGPPIKKNLKILEFVLIWTFLDVWI